MEEKRIRVALAGNPNSGKTTIFNQLTGAHQKVGNWPGVTVEKKEGMIHKDGYRIELIDLPGTYSLTPFSLEEVVARNFILEEKPDVVIDIIDASNLERSLYLANQLRELGCRVVFALNMADLARAKGLMIDAKKMSDLLGIPVVLTVANKGEGLDEMLDCAIEIATRGTPVCEARRIHYNKDIEEAVSDLKANLKELFGDSPPFDPRWGAIKLLENDSLVIDKLKQLYGSRSNKVLESAIRWRNMLADRLGDEPEIIITDERYGFIAGIVAESVTESGIKKIDVSRNIDLVLTNRFLGFPVFIFFIWLMFQATFKLGAYPMEWIESGVSILSATVDAALGPGLLKEFLKDGVVAGVGSVIIFLPNILILFFFIALFEDTGYMARAAFLMDRVMHTIGLHGKSFIPMLMGFGCNVPAIMAARTLESQKDRILTILITPFMSCSARLPVYIVLAGTFFAAHAGTLIFVMYMSGILAAIVSGRLFRSVLLRGEDAPFVMELPPYRMPMLKSLLIHMWDRSRMFLRKMGGIILIGSILIWGLSAFPRPDCHFIPESSRHISSDTFVSEEMDQHPAAGIEHSYLARIGKIISPVFEPIGIDWKGSVALLTGFVAKEIVVSTMGVLYAGQKDTGSDALRRSLAESGMTPASALSLMVFVLLYVPCIATISAVARETGSAGWAFFSVGYNLVFAWFASFLVYHAAVALI